MYIVVSTVVSIDWSFKRIDLTNLHCLSFQSYTNKTGFILTHHPTTENAVDFLRLVIDHESEVVIFMEPLSTVESVWVLHCSWFHNVSSGKINITYKKFSYAFKPFDLQNVVILLYRDHFQANYWLPQLDNPTTVTPFKTRLLQNESKGVKCIKMQIIREVRIDSYGQTLSASVVNL